MPHFTGIFKGCQCGNYKRIHYNDEIFETNNSMTLYIHSYLEKYFTSAIALVQSIRIALNKVLK